MCILICFTAEVNLSKIFPSLSPSFSLLFDFSLSHYLSLPSLPLSLTLFHCLSLSQSSSVYLSHSLSCFPSLSHIRDIERYKGKWKGAMNQPEKLTMRDPVQEVRTGLTLHFIKSIAYSSDTILLTCLVSLILLHIGEISCSEGPFQPVVPRQE